MNPNWFTCLGESAAEEQEEVKEELLPGGDHDQRCAPLCTAGGFLPHLSPLCLLHRLISPSSLTGDVAPAHPASCVWIPHPLFSHVALLVPLM